MRSDPNVPRGGSEAVLGVQAVPAATRRTLVLVVDDDPIIAAAFRRLEGDPEHPFRYAFAAGCAEALVSLRATPPALVLADYLLGDGYGIDLIALSHVAPVVIMTGHGSERVAVEALRAGASDYLIKDGTGGFLDLVVPTIDRVLARRRTEFAERQRASELAQSQRENRALEQFAVLVANALSDPLEVLVERCAALRATAAHLVGPELAEQIGGISRRAERARSQVAEVLEYARSMTCAASMRDVDPAVLLQELARELGPQLEAKRARLVVGALPLLKCDPGHMRSLWSRLLKRALQRRCPSELEIRVSAARCAGGWEFAVHDNGRPGSGDEAERFGASAGPDDVDASETGVVIAICRRILERYGGRLRVESSASEGSAVIFTWAE